ncbi:hypothetical protein DXA30_12395 [Fusobacterium ulcerans]|uniref:hypothetical protein n=1 Tax=Fusobacterium ulcerans TaxID=861 RepID=UPI000E54EDC4|nr:hypothetical protein [Fusobacterium ulcerans]RGY62439.1 hypothetical protein DXA30_12395 [Fusobacterium ulcerans]
MKIIGMASHNIILEKDKIERKQMKTSEANIFFNSLIEEILNKETKKAYKIVRETTEVVSIIKEVYNTETLTKVEDSIPARLLEKEKEAQKEIDKMKKTIRKGCLLQALVEKDEKKYFIISKVEATDGLDMDDFTFTNILPSSKKVLKNCLFELEEEGEISNIYLSDTNGNISKYWYDDFLELEEMLDDEKNTKDMFSIFTKEIKNKLEKISPSDYIICRNSAITYFKTNDNFNLTKAINTIFGMYEFENEELRNKDIPSKIQKKIQEKIQIKKLDTEFKLCPKMISSRKTKVRRELTQNISIEVEDYLENMKNDIIAFEEGDEKYIKIRTTNENSFKYFNWKK